MQKNVEKFGISDKRGRLRTSSDPFVSSKVVPEPALCRRCQTYLHNKRWIYSPETYHRLESEPNVHWLTCPACKKVSEGYVVGILNLSGSYLWEHEEEIRHLIKNEEAKAFRKNPHERIIRIARQDEELLVETTEQRLAEHLGRVLHRAHSGELEINWGSDADICRVKWEREL